MGGPSCDVRGFVDAPGDAQEVSAGAIEIRGWAADIASPVGTGISAVRVTLDGTVEEGGLPVSAAYGEARPDVATVLNDQRFSKVGFTLSADGSTIPPGQHMLYVELQSACGWTAMVRRITVATSNG